MGKDSIAGVMINDLRSGRPESAVFNLTRNRESVLLIVSSLVRCRAIDRPVADKGFLAQH